MMKRLTCLIQLAVLTLAACGPSVPAPSTPQTRTLTVFAAASLTEAFTEIGENFEASIPGSRVTFNFAGSQALRTQIEEGAPADVFASANQTEMDTLVAGSFVAKAAPRVFLHNKLVVILPRENTAALDGLEDLSNADIKLVLAAEEVPVGKYARQALEAMNTSFGADFKDQVLANVVSNEDNVRQVVAKVQLGEADAGIVYASDAVAVPDLKIIEISVEFNVIAKYPIAPITQSADPELASAFVNYVLSPKGQAVLEKWGFAPAE